ncbi:MAG: hypothetical protein PVH73_10400 [Candidatus Bathyarchaeota archaeon]|jgi:hypothetical protein
MKNYVGLIKEGKEELRQLAGEKLKPSKQQLRPMVNFPDRYSRINALNTKIDSTRLTQINYGSSFLDEAVQCFLRGLPMSCIVVSSALIERTLCWQKMRETPKGVRIKGLNLGKLFKEFVDWDILQETLLDTDEQLDLKLKKERDVPKNKIQKWASKLRYVETRNLFAHGKDLLFSPMPLTQLLPADSYANSEYGIESEEWWNPNTTTIAYVHLSKTLRFMKAFTDFLAQNDNRIRQ